MIDYYASWTLETHTPRPNALWTLETHTPRPKICSQVYKNPFIYLRFCVIHSTVMKEKEDRYKTYLDYKSKEIQTQVEGAFQVYKICVILS